MDWTLTNTVLLVFAIALGVALGAGPLRDWFGSSYDPLQGCHFHSCRTCKRIWVCDKGKGCGFAADGDYCRACTTAR